MSSHKLTSQSFYWFPRITKTSWALAFVVVVLGAWVRLSDAGLGCPDWPGCYGHLFVPETAEAVSAANELYPERPVEAEKAWKEMIHRYAASALGLLILILTIMAWWNKDIRKRAFTTTLLALVCFQGALGMWTVTHLVNASIVTMHLAGGMTTLGMLWWLVLATNRPTYAHMVTSRVFFAPAMMALLLIIVQMLLGAWTSTNYAAQVCPDFPTCQGQWVPPMDFAEGFVMWRPLGVDYEGGVLSAQARTAIQFVHRIGAIVLSLWLLMLAFRLIMMPERARLKKYGVMIIVALGLQLAIGIAMVTHEMPLWLGTAHNGGAAVLMMVILGLLHQLKGMR